MRVRELASHGFTVLATPGTAGALRQLGRRRRDRAEGGAGHARRGRSASRAGDVDLVINTVGAEPAAVRDSASIRRAALLRSLPYFTTVAGARAAVGAIRALQLESIGVRSLQDIHPAVAAPAPPTRSRPAAVDVLGVILLMSGLPRLCGWCARLDVGAVGEGLDQQALDQADESASLRRRNIRRLAILLEQAPLQVVSWLHDPLLHAGAMPRLERR